MKAAICPKYGPPEVLQITEVDKPVPGKNEVLIKVRASSVNGADCNTRGLTYIPSGLGLMARLMLGLKRPKKSILGSVLAGEVEAVGPGADQFKAGDRVYGTGDELGGYAEYACRSVDGALAVMPEKSSYEEVVTLPYGALTALYFLRDRAEIKSGQKVLVNGASGSVGVFAVQLARYFGAEVTGVCSTRNIELVRSLGAKTVIDYTKEDFTASGETYNIIFDVVVGKTSFARSKDSLKPEGYYLAVAGGIKDMLQMVRTSIGGGKKVIFGGGAACEIKENLIFLGELLEKGELKPVIGKSFSLDQIAEAHRYAESGGKSGNVVITV